MQERLARGGMGVVFKGDDERLHRPVCVKVFLPLDPSRPEYGTVLEHFVQEAFTLSRLTHPNTLRIYDFGYLDEDERTGPFFVTEFADGGTLADVVGERGELAAAEVLRILEPVVGALAEAHDTGIVHRDIKPSNVLFSLAGGGLIPKLCDFSIAKTTGDFPNRAQDTNTQVPLFSASWAAPEQLVGGAAVGPSADVFALALTTVFMLTGSPLYPDDDLLKAYALRAEGEEARRKRLEVLVKGASVRKVLLRACAEQPDERFSTVQAYLDALRDAFASDGRDLDPADADLSVVSALPSPPLPAFDESEEVTTAIHRGLYVVGSEPGHAPPQPNAPPSRPHFRLASLSQAHVVIGTRRARLLEASETVLAFQAEDGGETPRIRVTAMDIDGARVHIKGLNCFVRARGGRPSSGLDVKASLAVELLSVRQTVSARVGVAVGRHQANTIVCDLPEFTLVVSTSLASWVVVLDSPSSPEAIVLYRGANA